MVDLTHGPIDVETIRTSLESPELGAVVVFCGEVRSITDGSKTDYLTYTAYEPMAIEQMHAIAQDAASKYQAAVAIVHRLGKLFPKDIAVVTAAAAPHRAAAFDCCRFLIDEVKSKVPIWKKEGGS